MKKNFLNIFLVIAIISLIIPQLTFAAWWNPSTWFSGWSFTQKVETKEGLSTKDSVRDDKIKQSSTTNTVKPDSKPITKTNIFSIKDNINSGIVNENTEVVLNFSYSGKFVSDFDIRFTLVRDTDNYSVGVGTGINFEYFMNNGGVYKPKIKALLPLMSNKQTSTTTYHIRADVIKSVSENITSTTVGIKKDVQFSANSSKFMIVIKSPVKSTILFSFPSIKSVLRIGQSYDMTWTGSAPELPSYGIYLNNSSLGFDNRTYLGSVNSSQQKFTIKVSPNITPSLYRIQFYDGNNVFAYSDKFVITNNPNYTVDSSQSIDINVAAQVKLRQAQISQELMEDATKEKECPAEGAKFLNLFIKNNGQFPNTSNFAFSKIIGQPQYHYNKKASSCFIKFTHTISPSINTAFIGQIRDVYSTKLITYGAWSSEKDLGTRPNREDFESEAKSLMND